MSMSAEMDLLRRYEVPLSYCKVDDRMDSIICFYNYYDQIFPDKEISVDLHLMFFDSMGRLVKSFTEVVEPHQGTQIEASSLVESIDGMVGVAAKPTESIEVLAKDRFQLRPRIGTGYYMLWRDQQSGAVDISHEWESLATKPSGVRHYYVPFMDSDLRLRRGVILMNVCSVSGPEAVSNPVIEVRDSLNKVVFGRTELEPLPAMGTRQVDLDSVFPNLQEWARGSAITLKVSGANLAAPLSVERHPSGDFHIHHS